MTRPYRILMSVDVAVAEPPEPTDGESNYVIILAALLCALICVVGLISAARCAWLRRGSATRRGHTDDQQYENKGIKKKMIEMLPKLTYEANGDNKSCGKLCSSECAICLGEYVNGDEIRVLPPCGHGFHVGCVDVWLSSHSTCPTCRRILVSRRCKKCGEFSTVSGGNVLLEVDGKCRKHNSVSCSRDYLP